MESQSEIEKRIDIAMEKSLALFEFMEEILESSKYNFFMILLSAYATGQLKHQKPIHSVVTQVILEHIPEMVHDYQDIITCTPSNPNPSEVMEERYFSLATLDHISLYKDFTKHRKRLFRPKTELRKTELLVERLRSTEKAVAKLLETLENDGPIDLELDKCIADEYHSKCVDVVCGDHYLDIIRLDPETMAASLRDALNQLTSDRVRFEKRLHRLNTL